MSNGSREIDNIDPLSPLTTTAWRRQGSNGFSFMEFKICYIISSHYWTKIQAKYNMSSRHDVLQISLFSKELNAFAVMEFHTCCSAAHLFFH